MIFAIKNLWVVILLSLPGCTASHPPPTPPILIELDTCKLTQQDLDLRAKVLRSTYTQTISRVDSAIQLMHACAAGAIYAKYKQPVDETLLQAESDRIQTTTLMPNELKKIQTIFEGNTQDYLRVYVFPVFIERELNYGFYRFDTRVHEKTRAQARTLLNTLKNYPRTFHQVAAENTLSIHTSAYHTGRGFIPMDEIESIKKGGANTHLTVSESQDEFTRSLPGPHKLSQLKPGDLYPQIIELEENFLVLILKQYTPATQVAVFDMLALPKRPFDEWFMQELSSISAAVHDSELKEAVLSRVPWAAHLRWK